LVDSLTAERDLVETKDSGIEEVSRDFGTRERMIGMLSVVTEELDDVPGYFSVDRMASAMKIRVPGFMDIR
jgi:tRNA G26 N,N-dimethylase Trm1